MQTHFLSQFSTTTKLNAGALPRRVYGKAKARPSLARDELKIGDTVLVELGGGSTSREPSVAVVTGVWKVMIGEEVFCVNVGVHWFVRPSQLPRVRAAREHLEVRSVFVSYVKSSANIRDVVRGCRMRYTTRCLRTTSYRSTPSLDTARLRLTRTIMMVCGHS